jgi:hypothetical protein
MEAPWRIWPKSTYIKLLSLWDPCFMYLLYWMVPYRREKITFLAVIHINQNVNGTPRIVQCIFLPKS